MNNENKAYVWGNHYHGDFTQVFFVLPSANPRTPEVYAGIFGELVTKYRREDAPWAGVIACHTRYSNNLIDELRNIFMTFDFEVINRPATEDDNKENCSHDRDHSNLN